MELFNAIPSSLFTLLTSKNRELYASGLLLVREAFSHDLSIEKEALVSSLSTSLSNKLNELEDDEGLTENDIKDNITKSRFLIKRFKETGWIDSEFATGNKLVENLTLPPYSSKLLDLLYNLTSEELKEYDAFMYSIYSSLNSADKEYNDYRYTALNTSFDKINEFETTLKNLYIDLRRHYTRMTHLKDINDMLYEHFDSYQREIIKQIYLPLKTKDSLSRFKGPIIDILASWLRDNKIMEDMITQAVIQKHFKTRELANEDIIYKINFITDKLISLQTLINDIDNKNTSYVQTATDKLRVLLNGDKSIKAKLEKIIQKLAIERLDNDNTSFKAINEIINLNGTEFLSEDSLFIRKDAERELGSNEPIMVVDFDDNIASDALNNLSDSVNSPYSNENIQKYMHVILDEKESVNISELNVNNMDALIMSLYCFINGFDPKSFYKTILNNGPIENEKYYVPDSDFVRRREK